MPSSAAVVEGPDERGTRVQIAGQLRKPHVIGLHAGHDFAADLPHRCVVITEQASRHLFFSRRVLAPPGPHERDVPADILPQELLGLEQVVLVVLFENPDTRRVAQRPEVNGRRIDRRSDVHVVKVGYSASELEIANLERGACPSCRR